MEDDDEFEAVDPSDWLIGEAGDGWIVSTGDEDVLDDMGWESTVTVEEEEDIVVECVYNGGEEEEDIVVKYSDKGSEKEEDIVVEYSDQGSEDEEDIVIEYSHKGSGEDNAATSRGAALPIPHRTTPRQRQGAVEDALARLLPAGMARRLAWSTRHLDAIDERLKSGARSAPAGDDAAVAQASSGARLAKRRPRAADAARSAHRTGLRVLSGSRARLRLLAPSDAETRPMMARVRGAVFDMLAALCGTPGTLPPRASWLDLYAGTGAVGLEALSRGAAHATFIEADPWTSRHVLQANIATAGYTDDALVVVSRVEDHLRRQTRTGGPAAGTSDELMHPDLRTYDYVSICPPYDAVDYAEVFRLLAATDLVHPGTFVVVEYPRLLAHVIGDHLGPLVRLRNRRYGRTLLAVYGPESLW